MRNEDGGVGMRQFFVGDSRVGKGYVTITGRDVNHIKNVLRMKPGERIRVSNASGEDFLCELTIVSDAFVQADILDEEALSAELPSKVFLFQALPKGNRMEYVIQKAVELGVREIIPVRMRYCVVRLEGERAEKKTRRWQAIAESAAKQAKRSLIPRVCPPMQYEKALARAKSCDVRLVPYEGQEGMEGTADALRKLAPGRSVSVLIGPEGGFSPEEIAAARAGMDAISLGRRVLRADTAAICALSAVMLALEKNG